MRNRVERGIYRLKASRRFATRYDKLRETFHAFVNLAAIRLWIRDFVNRA
jgi:transposase